MVKLGRLDRDGAAGAELQLRLFLAQTDTTDDSLPELSVGAWSGVVTKARVVQALSNQGSGQARGRSIGRYLKADRISETDCPEHSCRIRYDGLTEGELAKLRKLKII